VTALVVALGVVAVDLGTKLAVGRLVAPAGIPFVRPHRNPRGAIAPVSVGWAAVVLVGLAAAFAAVVRTTPAAVGAGLVVGGATANLWDRIRNGGVLDFIAIGRWPVFNGADAALVVGVVVSVVGMR
jgi:signal peptidase II